MKNLLVSILTFLYFSTSIGADVYLNYFQNDSSAATCLNACSNICDPYNNDKKNERGKFCCQQENKHSNYKNYHLAAFSFHHLHHPVSVALSVRNFIIHSTNHSVIATGDPVSSSLSQNSGVAVYIRNCVFLI